VPDQLGIMEQMTESDRLVNLRKLQNTYRNNPRLSYLSLASHHYHWNVREAKTMFESLPVEDQLHWKQAAHVYRHDSKYPPFVRRALVHTTPKKTVTPKGPNPYILFSRHQWNTVYRSKRMDYHTEFIPLVSMQWKQLSERDKQPFIRQAERVKGSVTP